jgi:hypothetical protein
VAKLTRSERLTKQGIVYFEADGILVRLTKKQSIEPDRNLQAIKAVSLAAPLSVQMRARVTVEGETADGRFSGYSTRAAVKLSQDYATAAQGLDGRRWWRNSAALHASLARSLFFHVTGGMWKGLQVRGSGRNVARIDFQGSSMGRGSTTIARTRRGKPFVVVKPEIVRNSTKAFGIWEKKAINVVEPRVEELSALAVVAGEAAARGIALAWGEDLIVGVAPGFRAMVESARRAMAADGVR